jgi:CAAX protease family protein
MDGERHVRFDEHAQRGRGPSEPPAGSGLARPVAAAGKGEGGEPPVGPVPNDWPVWSGLVVLLAALVLAAVGALIVDIPALLVGAKITSKHTPAGIELADTIVQDVVFVLTAIMFAQMGGRKARSWQFGLRPTPVRRAVVAIALLIVAFLLFTTVWVMVLEALGIHIESEKLLEKLGANGSAVLLGLSALLTTAIAPVCEELLFRGYIFAALSKWRGWLPAAAVTGLMFGGVHAGSAPVEDLVPLAALGFLLCALYRYTGSLYPCIAAHSLNNSFAFGKLEHWGWQIPLLMGGALVTIWLLAKIAERVGLITDAPPGGVLAQGS